MKKSLVVISLLIGSMALIGCSSDDSSDDESLSSSSSSSPSTSASSSSSGSGSENSGESLSKLHIDDASDLYGYTIKVETDKSVFTYSIDCSGNFTQRWTLEGRVFDSFSAEGDTIDTTNKGIDFIYIDSDDGEEHEVGFSFKNDNQDLVVGQTNYDGLVEVFITSIIKNSSCN